MIKDYEIILGKVNDDIEFTYGEETATYYGCGATLRGEFWYFGGYVVCHLLVFLSRPLDSVSSSHSSPLDSV